MKLILEFTEFNHQRMNSDSVPQSTHVDDPQLSLGSFNRFQSNLKNAVNKLNSIYKKMSITTSGVNLTSGKPIEQNDIKNIKILRIFPSDDIYYNVYFSFELEENEYYGVIKKINHDQPILSSEIFKDVTVFGSKEWVIRVKGNLVKTIKNWLNVTKGEYLSLKEIEVIDKLTGELILLPEKSKIEVLGTFDSVINITHEDREYDLKNGNYYYFNYYFENLN